MNLNDAPQSTPSSPQPSTPPHSRSPRPALSHHSHNSNTIDTISHSAPSPNRRQARSSSPPLLPPPLSSGGNRHTSPQSPRASNQLPPLSPPSTRQRAQLQAIQKAVDAEKRRLKKSDDRNVHLNQVRRIFADFFQAPEDEDFYSTHVTAPREVVDRYLDGEGPGPDVNDLHFTDLDPHNNAWNRAVCSCLAQELWKRQRTESWVTKTGKGVAAGSEAYWEDAVLQKFKRIRKGWMDAQLKTIQDHATGQQRTESQQEAYTRRWKGLEETRTATRQRMRRHQVS